MKKREYGMVGGKRRNVYISQEDWEVLRELGNGNASKAIRDCLKTRKPRATLSRQMLIGFYRCGWDDAINRRPYNPTGKEEFDKLARILDGAGKGGGINENL